MRLLVVGGHTRNIGKTALVVDLLRAFPEAAWTAVKITQYGHGLCTREGEPCGCAPDEHTFALDEEQDSRSGTDTSRFLAAGAAHALWLRTKQGRLAEALPLLRQALERHAGAEGNVILESNTLLQFLRPQLYIVVLDPTREDFKDSARLHLDRANAVVIRQPAPPLDDTGSSPARKIWGKGVPERLIDRVSQFYQPLGDPLPQALLESVRGHFLPSERVSTRNNSYLPS
jgi:hypothetical protein